MRFKSIKIKFNDVANLHTIKNILEVYFYIGISSIRFLYPYRMTSWDVARLTVRLGDYDIKTPHEVRHVEKRVKRVVRHRGFDMRTLYNDVAILTLNEPVEFSETIRPVCLPSGSNLYAGQKAVVIGWGSLRESKYITVLWIM